MDATTRSLLSSPPGPSPLPQSSSGALGESTATNDKERREEEEGPVDDEGLGMYLRLTRFDSWGFGEILGMCYEDSDYDGEAEAEEAAEADSERSEYEDDEGEYEDVEEYEEGEKEEEIVEHW